MSARSGAIKITVIIIIIFIVVVVGGGGGGGGGGDGGGGFIATMLQVTLTERNNGQGGPYSYITCT